MGFDGIGGYVDGSGPPYVGGYPRWEGEYFCCIGEPVIGSRRGNEADRTPRARPRRTQPQPSKGTTAGSSGNGWQRLNDR